MRILATGLAIAGLLASQAASAAGTCARPTDMTAFDVVGLKSELMVTAITCHAQDKYNAFVNRYRNDLVSSEAATKAFFSRAYGRNAQKQNDDYITQLANVQSQAGLKRGTLFCNDNLDMFDEVMALRSGADLPAYAAGKGIVQPAELTDCSATMVAEAPRATVRKTSAHGAKVVKR